MIDRTTHAPRLRLGAFVSLLFGLAIAIAWLMVPTAAAVAKTVDVAPAMSTAMLPALPAPAIAAKHFVEPPGLGVAWRTTFNKSFSAEGTKMAGERMWLLSDNPAAQNVKKNNLDDTAVIGIRAWSNQALANSAMAPANSMKAVNDDAAQGIRAWSDDTAMVLVLATKFNLGAGRFSGT